MICPTCGLVLVQFESKDVVGVVAAFSLRRHFEAFRRKK